MLRGSEYHEEEQLEVSIMSVLTYFDLFNFPITEDEIYLFLNRRCTMDCICRALAHLNERKVVYKTGNYYAVKDDYYLAERREKGAAKAEELLQIAQKISAWLVKFPFVRGIAISGSLSKKYADENSDIDFFIITQTGKLWIARTFLHLFKKLTFLFHKENYFCMNYFVDEANAEIREQNHFTAVEIVTLIPMQGDMAFETFYNRNAWTRHYLPNNVLRVTHAHAAKPGLFKLAIEALFNNAVGRWLNRWLMAITAKRWQKKTDQGRLNARGIVMSMVAGDGFSKPNPVNFQRKVLEDHQHNLDKLTQRLKLSVA